MNYLAHAWLSGPHSQWILGGFLGDHVRGGRWREYPREVGLGILLHRRVDGYVDNHPAFVACRELFEPPFRRYAGILLDLAFDHLLARRWATYADVSLEDFAARCHAILAANWSVLPASLHAFTHYARKRNLLVGYREPAVIAQSLAGISRRLSRDNPLNRGWDALEPRLPRIASELKVLFPDLQVHAARQRSELNAAGP